MRLRHTWPRLGLEAPRALPQLRRVALATHEREAEPAVQPQPLVKGHQPSTCLRFRCAGCCCSGGDRRGRRTTVHVQAQVVQRIVRSARLPLAPPQAEGAPRHLQCVRRLRRRARCERLPRRRVQHRGETKQIQQLCLGLERSGGGRTLRSGATAAAAAQRASCGRGVETPDKAIASQPARRLLTLLRRRHDGAVGNLGRLRRVRCERSLFRRQQRRECSHVHFRLGRLGRRVRRARRRIDDTGAHSSHERVDIDRLRATVGAPSFLLAEVREQVDNLHGGQPHRLLLPIVALLLLLLLLLLLRLLLPCEHGPSRQPHTIARGLSLRR